MAKKTKPTKLPQPVTKEKLSTDEMEKIGKHAGHVAREIELAEIGLKTEKKKHKEKTDPLKLELSTALKQLRTGFKEVSAQQKMFGDK